MVKLIRYFWTAALLMCFVLQHHATAEVLVEPFGIAVASDSGDTHEFELTIINDGDEEVSYNLSLMTRVWDENERLGPYRDERGGPDDATYEWRDDDEDDCPGYDWIDITEFEDAVDIEGLTDDSLAGEFEFDFTMEYYGDEFDMISLFPNGMACLGEDPGTISYFYPQMEGQWPEDLPTDVGVPPPPPNLLCVSYQDLNPSVAGHMYYWTDDAMAICTWEDVPHFVDAQAENDLWTFQLIVYASGLIKIQYAGIGMYDDADVMIGFQNGEQNMGFTIMRNDFDYLQEERVVAFGPEDAWITWVTVDPASGVIGAGDDEAILVAFNAEDIDPGVYYAILNIGLDLEDQRSIEIPLIMSVDSPVGAIEGIVTDAADEEPIMGAYVVLEPSGLMRTTDNHGRYEMTELPVGIYHLTCDIPDYLPFVSDDIEVVEDETTDGSMALLHAEFNPSHEEIVEMIPIDEQRRVEFEVSNDGNGDLEFIAERRLPGPADADPWELRQTFAVSELLQDDRLEGIIFDGENFFISGGNRFGREDSTNMIYVLDREGEFVRRFEQAGEAASGMRDLAWDGDLIWGSGERNVYGFTVEGDVEATWAGPHGSTQALAFDPDREVLWLAGITTDIIGYQRDGEQRFELDRNGMRIYGLAYWEDDPDDFPLYVYHCPEGDAQVIHKINPENGDTMLVRELDPEAEGRSGGAFISNGLDIYSWVFIALVNNGDDDRIDIWQLETRMDWMLLDPLDGIIRAGESGGFTLDLDATGMPVVTFEGELVFTHNGVGGESIIPVTMNVTGGDEPQPPSDFNLLEPIDGDTLYAEEVQAFIWEESIDPNEADTVNYVLWFKTVDDSVETALADTTLEILPDTLFVEMERPLDVTWWVQAVSGEHTVECLQRFGCWFFPSHDVGDREPELPEEVASQAVYPNPFNAQVRINYSLNRNSQTGLKVIDFTGRMVEALDFGSQTAGYYSAVVDASTLPSGIYFVQLTAGSEIRTAKLLCVK